MTNQLMACPVCDRGGAENRTPPDFDGLIVRCSPCGGYTITGSVMGRFARLDAEQRREVFDKARRLAQPDGHPVIDSVSMS